MSKNKNKNTNKNKYSASFATVKVGKVATFGFKHRNFRTLREFAEQTLKQAWIPVKVKRGKRDYDSVVSIDNWMRFDCDKEGEKETITSLLKSNSITHICVPSTNFHPKHKSYKWHISVPVKGVAKDVMQYKRQIKEAMSALGINIYDTRMSEVCVQNTNPFQNGRNFERGVKYIEIFEGNRYKLNKVDKNLKFSPMQKVIFNGRGGNVVINKKVVRATEHLEVLSRDSGIKLDGVGWITLKDLDLEQGAIISGLSCPAHNINHTGGAHKTGYAYATMNEAGDVWVTCTGASCKGKSYKMEQIDFGAETKLSDLFEIRKFVSMTAYNFEKNAIVHVKEDASIVNFRWTKESNYFLQDDLIWKLDMSETEHTKKLLAVQRALEIDEMHNAFDPTKGSEKEAESKLKELGLKVEKTNNSFIKTLLIHQNKNIVSEKTNAIIAENEHSIIKKALNSEFLYKQFVEKYYEGDKPKGYQGYIKDVRLNIERYLKINNQFNSIKYSINPYAKGISGDVKKNVFEITTNTMINECNTHNPSSKYINDYKEHNPYLDDIVDMMVMQRFGADKKASYLWLKCPSNWGKSFLFQGVLGDMVCEMNMNELKKAMKGEPSGIEPLSIVRSSALFFDEFKGAVSELKNITHEISISPKNRNKYTVPVYLKVMASAEDVPSLQSDAGSEEQFRNRLLKIEATGDLVNRPLYADDKAEYFKALKAYVNNRICALQEHFKTLGDVNGIKEADEKYSEFVAKYTIKHVTESFSGTLPVLFNEWIDLLSITNKTNYDMTNYIYKNTILFKAETGQPYALNLQRAKDLFIIEGLAEDLKATVRYKSYKDVIKYDKRTTIRISGKPINVYPLES